MGDGTHEVASLFIAPDRILASRFAAARAQARCFTVVAEIEAYPSDAELETRLRQTRPEAVLVDVATDPDRAAALMAVVARVSPRVPVVGVHSKNDAEAILRALRQGAAEFLYAPFDQATQRQAAERIRRLIEPAGEKKEDPDVIAFASAKPGSGASTLAVQTAFALRSLTAESVLLADMGISRSTVAFYGNSAQGIDVAGGVPAPDWRDAARGRYRWLIADLPCVFSETSVAALERCDRIYLVATPDLPSLHLARKAAILLERSHESLQREVILNRVERRRALDAAEMSRALGRKIRHLFPNEPAAVERALTARDRLAPETSLGRVLSEFAAELARTASQPFPAPRT